jgi:Tfp pilus assembly protein PilF/peroxiredoxin
MSRSASHLRLALKVLVATLTTAGVGVLLAQDRSGKDGNPNVYRPALAPPDFMAPFLEHVEPGNDAFAAERDAEQLASRLGELRDRLRAAPARAAEVSAWLLAEDFRGGRLFEPATSSSTTDAALEIRKDKALHTASSIDARSFAAEFGRLLEDLRDVRVAEFLIASIAPQPSGGLDTEVRYDIVGSGKSAWRVEHVGVWRMRWRRVDAQWRVVEWTAVSHVASRAKSAIFTEITQRALGANESFARQLAIPLDAWQASLDSVLTRDSNGHHGISVGDADGDGLEDLYVAQPAGLPNRLYRARGDSTYEDVTERSGLGVLDDTAESLFADVDNDGDQDLVLATATRPMVFLNDGSGRFSVVPDAFQFERPLQGVLTSIAMADYDRDGDLDLYLCVYSYFFGAGEDKAGTPAPYYDARNGPPGVLFRNDGKGRFVDATEEAGLGPGNDRYHFAATWADYDGDGWPDLLVANDFGTKNLYRNRGRQNGRVTFEDVAAAAGVLDHAAGMSAAFVDYDNDGLLDIYTGNMWTDVGLRVTASPAFLPDAPPDVRALYRHHARGNSLFRNRGDGRFEDKTIEAGAEMGRWAWCSDALDFDSDGWEDLYVANGMLTREPDAPDLEGFFWRQVVARSPLTRLPGTPYDDAWRAMNQLLIHDSIAGHQRNVLLRNDGKGGFDEVSGAVGLDLDQDGRSFAVLDLDGDGDQDLAIMAARQAPQLRIFRNDFAGRRASLAIRLVGSKSNRDAVGARVTVETERLRRTKIVQAGSGFLSERSKELLFGLGPSERVAKVTVEWPSGARQEFTRVTPNSRLRLVEGGELESKPFSAATATASPAPERAPSSAAPPDETWLYEPFPAPDFSAPDVRGENRSLGALRGRPAVVLLWSAASQESRAALEALARGNDALAKARIGLLAIALDPANDSQQPSVALPVGIPVVAATKELGLSYAILNRHMFMNRQPLRLPTTLLLDEAGSVVKAYRRRVDAADILRDASAIQVPPEERLRRALPFPGRLYAAPPLRNYLPYGRELLDQGLEAAAVVAFDRAAQANPSASTLYRLGTLLARSGDAARARAAYERAIAMQPGLAEAINDLGALLAQQGDLDGAIARFRAALVAAPDYPDALNNLGYALLLTGHNEEARALYEKALALQPDFPEALNNLGLLFGRAGEMAKAERFFRDALARRADYGEAANNLALVLVARRDPDAAVRLLEDFLRKNPTFEDAYVTLAKIYLSAGKTAEGIRIIERLLQRNPTHAVALELLRQWKPR